MAKPAGLNRRGNTYFLRVVIPEAVRSFYGGKARVNAALGTSDYREACIKGHAVRAQWEADIEAKRRSLNPQAVAEVTPELAATLAAAVRHRVLSGDEATRNDPAVLDDLRRAVAHARAPSALTIGPWHPAPAVRPVDDLGGATPAEAEAYAGLNAHVDGAAAVDLARGNLAAILPMVEAEAKALGIAFDPALPGARVALLGCLKAYRQACQEVTQRDAGAVVDTPAAPVYTPPAPPRTLRSVFERWKVSGAAPKSKDAITAMDLALRQFEGQHPGIALEQITSDMGDAYRAWLISECRTPKTARDRFDRLKTLLRYATVVLRWIGAHPHPWYALNIKAKTTNPRRPWADSELQTLFGASLFTQYALPTTMASKSGRDAAYWIPLLGLFTGARPGELCQLHAADILTVEGVPCIRITDDGEGQSVKTEAGRRLVPIHSELLRLGFLGYVEAIRSQGPISLWPAMSIRPDKPSDYFGRWFREQRKAVGLVESRPDFYCFRHTVRPLMRKAGIASGTQDKITGHETAGSVGDMVYDHWTLGELRHAVETIRYPCLTLPVVSPHATREDA